MARSRQLTARMEPAVIERLERRGQRTGSNKSRLVERYVDEGVRMDEHPGVVFRDGPTGRRAGLAAGPDVWEVIQVLKATELTGENALAATAEWGGLTISQVRVAVGYYAEFRDEVDERVRRNVDEADEAERRWRRERDAIG